MRKVTEKMAKTLREVAASIKVNHKKFTTRTVDHAEAYVSRGGYRPTLTVRYQQTRADMYRSHELMTFWLTDGRDDDDVPPAKVRDNVLDTTKYVEKSAAQLAVEAETIDDIAAVLSGTVEAYNTVVDGLTVYGREVLGVQHIYNHNLEATR